IETCGLEGHIEPARLVARACEARGQSGVSVGVVRCEPNGVLISRDRLLNLPELAERRSDVDIGVRIIGPEANGFGEKRNRLRRAVQSQQRLAPVGLPL